MTTEFSVESLPSKGLAYNVKSISVEKFKVPQVAKMSQAAALNSLAPMAKAMSECTSIEQGLLTVGDMYYLLAWERCNSYSTPLVAEWDCRGNIMFEEETNTYYSHAEIVKLVDEYNEAEDKSSLRNPDEIQLREVPCNHHNVQSISFSEFEVVYLTDTPLDPELDYPRVKNLAQVVEMRKDPAIGSLATVAQWVKEGDSLADKLEVLSNQEDLVLFEKALTAETEFRHGIRNTIHKECTKCGTGSTHVVDINPKTFFLV